MPTLQSINASASPEVQMNQNFFAVAAAALFGRKDSTTAGLTFGYYGGIIGSIGAFNTIADGTVVLTGSTTNYIETTVAGVVSANTSAFTAGRIPLYTAVTSSTAITTLTDYRQSVAFPVGSVSVTTLTITTGTITADTPALSITQTWNNAGVNFIAADTNITNTASGASSMLHRWRVGGAVKASIDYLGALTLAAGLTLTGAIAGATTIAASGAITATSASPQLTLGVLNTTSGGIKFFGSTSGNVTLSPAAAAGASVTVTLPATSATLNAAGDLTGNTLNSGVVASSLTSVGTLTSLNVTGNLTTLGAMGVGTASPASGLSSSKTLNVYGGAGIGGELVLEGNSGGNFVGLQVGTSAGDLPIFLFNRGLRVGYATAKDATGYASLLAFGVSAGTLRALEGIRIGADSTNNLIDDASTGAGTATLYIGNASINVTSDERLKSNIRPLEDGLSIVNALLPIEYDQDEERPWGDVQHYIGFGARHSHKIAPWSVNTQGDTGLPWKMRQEFLMGPVVKAIQQVDERLRTLEARLK